MAEEEADLKKFESQEEMKMAGWLELTLKRYTANILQRKSQGRIVYVKTEINSLPIVITSLRFSSKDSSADKRVERGNQTHTISNIGITYSFCKDGVDRPQFFLSKSCRFYCNKPDYSDADANCLSINREVDFFTKVIPALEDWAFSKKLIMVLPVPYCYFGKFECTKVEKVDQRTKDYLTSIGIKYKVFPAANEFEFVNAIEYNYEVNTMLLFEDLTKSGFSKKKTFQLTVAEVHIAVEKLAQIHALSYALSKISEQSPKEKWNIFPDSRKMRQTYLNSIAEGFPVMLKLLKDYYKTDERGESVITRLEYFQYKIERKVWRLLRPARFPFPNSVIHMDLTPCNIYFQTELQNGAGNNFPFGLQSQLFSKGRDPFKDEFKEKNEENSENNNSSNENEFQPETPFHDCRIIRWKEVNYGACLHDVANLLFTSLSVEKIESSTIPILHTYYRKFRAICAYLDVDVYFNCQMLYDELPNSFLFSIFKIIKDLSENKSKIDSVYFHHFVKMVEYLIETNVI